MREDQALWHSKNPMPQDPSREERSEWHTRHAVACGCRPVPPDLIEDVEKLRAAKAKRGSRS